MMDVEVISDPAAAMAAMGPVRGRLLAELVQPASAAALAARMGMPRQKINYHLRELESHGLVRMAEERQWGGLKERKLVATAGSYVISAAALGPAAGDDPDRARDRLSAGYLIALAGRMIRELGAFLKIAAETGKRLPTLSIDAEIRFRSAAERAAFSSELQQAVAALASRYHDPHAEGGRPHRLVVVAHPLPQPSDETKNDREELPS
jgi:DNA-binding transcriptional ArsR family regulator